MVKSNLGKFMDAAGKEITWDMIHYDVQLIGGVA
jgi:preprotein translocase subunit SecA